MKALLFTTHYACMITLTILAVIMDLAFYGWLLCGAAQTIFTTPWQIWILYALIGCVWHYIYTLIRMTILWPVAVLCEYLYSKWQSLD